MARRHMRSDSVPRGCPYRQCRSRMSALCIPVLSQSLSLPLLLHDVNYVFYSCRSQGAAEWILFQMSLRDEYSSDQLDDSITSQYLCTSNHRLASLHPSLCRSPHRSRPRERLTDGNLSNLAVCHVYGLDINLASSAAFKMLAAKDAAFAVGSKMRPTFMALLRRPAEDVREYLLRRDRRLVARCEVRGEV